MAICPFATHRLIPPGASDPEIVPRMAILHVDAGNAETLYWYFKERSGGVESHFHVLKNGTIEQYRDTDYEADANYKANPFAISIETQGYGEGVWTPDQLTAIKRLLTWINQAHPLVKLTKPTRWDGSGVGYHTQFGAPGQWTPVAKSCPGPQRIEQYNDIIVRWMDHGTPKEIDQMQLSDDLYPKNKDKDVTVRNVLVRLDRYLASAGKRDARLRTQLAEIKKIVNSAPQAPIAGADADVLRGLLASLEATISFDINEDPS